MPSAPASIRSRAKLTTENTVSRCDTHAHDAPVSAGTESVVPVTNNIHTMPARAAGRPVMMTNGSSQDWKLTTINR